MDKVDRLKLRPKGTQPLNEIYETCVFVKDVDMGVDVITRWAKFFYNTLPTGLSIIKSLSYPAYVYLYNLNNNFNWARDDKGTYAIDRNYKPLSYDEFIKLYFRKPSKYVKQLKFESRENMGKNITDKIGNYLDEMDAGHDDFFEIKELERKLKTLENKKKELMKNDLKDEFDWSKIDKEIKKVEDRIRYLKK